MRKCRSNRKIKNKKESYSIKLAKQRSKRRKEKIESTLRDRRLSQSTSQLLKLRRNILSLRGYITNKLRR